MFPSTTVGWLEKLVSFDSTSRNSNLEIVNYMKSYLDSIGIPCVLQHDASKKKANIFATIPAQGGATEGGIILSGHLDVVPVDGQKWDTDPFKATTKGDAIFGRGTCDMKGFIAVCTALAPELKKLARTKPVYFAWTFDEEVGCLGGRVLTKFIKTEGIKVDGCVVGEPTSNKIIVAHKGICVWRVTVRGKACHSSYALTKSGCNAIDYAAKLIVKIREIAEDIQATCEKDGFYDVPFTTMSTNVINGGIAVNTIPALCVFNYEFRNLPTMTQESIQKRVADYVANELLPKMKRECAEADIVIENVAQVPHLCDVNEKDPFTELMRALTGDRDTRKLGGATEAGQYALVGVPVVVCGPGSITVAHQANEYVPLKDLEDCEKAIRSLISKNQAVQSSI